MSRNSEPSAGRAMYPTPWRSRTLRSSMRRIVGVATALVTGLAIGVVGNSQDVAWATSDQATSAKVNSDAFLAGMYVEAGLKTNGSFGSIEDAPGAFHPQPWSLNPGSRKLGFVAVRDTAQPDWVAAKAAGLVDGDFFAAGTPYEGWALKVDTFLASNNDTTSGIPGSLGGVTNATGTSGNNTVGWTSNAPFRGISIMKTYSLPQAGQRVDVSVTLTNSTGATISNIYYGRGVDPDDANNTANVFRSTNKVVSQISEGGSSSRVSAAFIRGSQIFLDSTDSRSRVAREVPPNPAVGFFSRAFDPQEVWDGSANGAGDFDRTVGTSAEVDSGINLAVKVDSLVAGQSTTFTFSYFLAPSAAEAADAANVGGAGATSESSVSNPAVHLDLQARVGQQGANTPVLMEGEGLRPGSTYSLTLREPSRVIQSGSANTGGRFSHVVNVPSDLKPGSYSITLSAIGKSGESLVLIQSFRIGADGSFEYIGSAVPTVKGGLAQTGPDSSAVLGGFALALLATLVGVALAVTSRRRAQSL